MKLGKNVSILGSDCMNSMIDTQTMAYLGEDIWADYLPDGPEHNGASQHQTVLSGRDTTAELHRKCPRRCRRLLTAETRSRLDLFGLPSVY